MNQTTGTFQSSVTHTRWRYLKDRLARYSVAIGGLSVIAAVMLIFVYLFYTVIPLFMPAEATVNNEVLLPTSEAKTLFLASEEQAEVGLRILEDGQIIFFNIADGVELKRQPLDLNAAEQLAQVVTLDAVKGIIATVSSQGRLFVLQHEYIVSYPDDQRLITPQLNFPFGEQAIALLPGAAAVAPVATITEPLSTQLVLDTLAAEVSDNNVYNGPVADITNIAIQATEEKLFAAVGYIDRDGASQLLLQGFDKESSLFSDSVTLTANTALALPVNIRADYLAMDARLEWLYVADTSGKLDAIALYGGKRAPQITQRVSLAPQGEKLTALNLLAGGISLIAGSSEGDLSQWFMVRDDDNQYLLKRIRGFDSLSDAAVEVIVPEYGRRGFLVADSQGQVGVYYSTSGRQLISTTMAASPSALAISPRADVMLAQTNKGHLQTFVLHNEHPEVSWSSLWGKVWYESYPEADYIWQSSSASNDFEPKFSLVPLSFGTLKAAFYAMLFAMPLAIMGAIYTAYFMAPGMRRKVKPTIEVMEALPTVILGFLAGLWLAPVVENNLPGIFSLLLLTPLAVLLFAFAWSRTPQGVRAVVPEGWQAALLVPVLLFFGWLAFSLSKPLELWLFGGDMPLWLDREMGISYDQRNALVVGLAMGFAVIPTIFSIAEDAIFSVPKQLSNGSLALGATPWQTLVRVVLPTASPGIFSSVMIGLGRAVGETMIVLMATGNTPLMDGSPFQGMRTLSANIAVEMPESEVGSTHFRILFLAGLVLFMFTFVFNTVAELVRQRLREKYSSL